MSEEKNRGINRVETGARAGDGTAVMLIKVLVLAASLTIALGYLADRSRAQRPDQKSQGFDSQISQNAQQMMEDGKRIFRYDTFGDEVYWTDKLKLHHAIQGSKFGGVGPGVSPKTALAVGLKVDMDALPADLVEKIKKGEVNLDDPATTLALIKLDSVLGVRGNLQPGWQSESCRSHLCRLSLHS